MGTVLQEGTRKKTRKAHPCVVCERTIPLGSEAHFQANVGADWGCCTVYWHTDCTPDFSYDF